MCSGDLRQSGGPDRRPRDNHSRSQEAAVGPGDAGYPLSRRWNVTIIETAKTAEETLAAGIRCGATEVRVKGSAPGGPIEGREPIRTVGRACDGRGMR